MGGMVGAMLVVVVVVVAFVALRGLNRDQPEVRPEPVDYLAAVEQARSAGIRPVHPAELPEGWIATSIQVAAAADSPEWGMGVLTDDGAFVGLRQQDVGADALVSTYVDEEAARGSEVDLEGTIRGPWQSWSDEGGDIGYTTEIGDESLLVYGSAPREDVEAFVALLDRG
jgi:hypothetical protein